MFQSDRRLGDLMVRSSKGEGRDSVKLRLVLWGGMCFVAQMRRSGVIGGAAINGNVDERDKARH